MRNVCLNLIGPQCDKDITCYPVARLLQSLITLIVCSLTTTLVSTDPQLGPISLHYVVEVLELMPIDILFL